VKARRFLVLALCLAACGGEGDGELVRLRVPRGASFAAVADTLSTRGLIGTPALFRLYARITGVAGRVKAGTYEFHRGAGWGHLLDALEEGRVLNVRITIPEGWEARRIAERIAEVSQTDVDSVAALLDDSAYARSFGVPGPTLEGYLYPATYTLPLEAPVDTVVARLVDTYRRVWTEERRAAAAAQSLSERDVVTLASIVEKEARVAEEMPVIAAVYRNRLRVGMPLQADPTVLYALGGHRERLLYAAMDSVQDHPYNTYAHAGLPPGPIASPSERAIDAVLEPANVNYLYFVARPDGSHIFSRTLAEHNRARTEVRRGGTNGASSR
jgi:UPF0755 protein